MGMIGVVSVKKMALPTLVPWWHAEYFESDKLHGM